MIRQEQQAIIKSMASKSDSGGIRTPNHQSRNLTFYPVELRSQQYKDKPLSRLKTIKHNDFYYRFC